MSSTNDLWLFGYGSLIWKPDFPFAERCKAHIVGWQRRFYQASPDHRGTPRAPGRVATLVTAADTKCWGAAYRVSAEDRDDVVARLDHREQAGYTQLRIDIHLDDGRVIADTLLYVANQSNPNFMGELTHEEIARVARTAVGPSGTNREYILKLADALRAMNVDDDHVAGLAELVR